MSDVFCQYPTQNQAQAALKAVYDHVTGTKKQDVAGWTNIGWTVEGYCASIGVPMISLPSAPAAPAQGGDSTMLGSSEQLLLEHLEPHFGAAQAHKLGDGTILRSIPWGTILPIVLQIAQGFIK